MFHVKPSGLPAEVAKSLCWPTLPLSLRDREERCYRPVAGTAGPTCQADTPRAGQPVRLLPDQAERAHQLSGQIWLVAGALPT